MFWFIVLLLIVGGGFYFYQKMMTIEREIRAEQDAAKAEMARAKGADSQVKEAAVKQTFSQKSSLENKAPDLSDEDATAEAVLAEVISHPGIRQADFYRLFADMNKKQLQQLIKELADKGVLRREKQGSSYLLYPG